MALVFDTRNTTTKWNNILKLKKINMLINMDKTSTIIRAYREYETQYQCCGGNTETTQTFQLNRDNYMWNRNYKRNNDWNNKGSWEVI